MFKPAHDVANNPTLGLSNYERLRKRVERIDEEVGSIILWQADSVDANNGFKVAGIELAQSGGVLNQQMPSRIFQRGKGCVIWFVLRLGPGFSRICLNEVFSGYSKTGGIFLVSSEPSPVSESHLPSFPLDFGSLRSMVEYRFTLLDSYVDVRGLPTFVVAREPVKAKFLELLKDLANHKLLAKIVEVKDKLVISVYPKPKLGQ